MTHPPGTMDGKDVMSLEKVRDYLKFRARYISNSRKEHPMLQCIEALNEHIAAQQRQRANPVAWLDRQDPTRCTTHRLYAESDPDRWIPVYFDPPSEAKEGEDMAAGSRT